MNENHHSTSKKDSEQKTQHDQIVSDVGAAIGSRDSMQMPAVSRENSHDNSPAGILLDRFSSDPPKPLSLAEQELMAGQAILEVQGGQVVFYKGSYVRKIPLTSTSISVGRRDIMGNYYPDIDLLMYRKMDPVISRRHLQIYRDINGKYFIEDLCNNSATFLNTYDDVLTGEKRELKSGDRIFVSMSISLLFKIV